jgi:hypothetical protein
LVGPESAFTICDDVWVGTRDLGEGCTDGIECLDTDTVFCAGIDDDGCGTCTVRPTNGDPCPDGYCSDGSVCSFETGLCVPLPGEGEACPDFDCADDLTCDDATAICVAVDVPTFEEGGPCLDGGCNGFVTGLACGVDDTCHAITVVQPGVTCTPGFEVDFYCVNQLSGVNACVDTDEDGIFTCTALPTAGDACLVDACDRNSTCDDTTSQCVALAGEGESCADIQCALGLECNADEVCEAFDEGDPPICAE